MESAAHEGTAYLRTLADGTTKQVNPFTGTEVWTVPGRGDRPLGVAPAVVEPLEPSSFTSTCAFCSDRYLETPPEKMRSVRATTDDPNIPLTFVRRRSATPAEITADVAEFRRIPNLFEIMSVDYWQANHGFAFPPHVTAAWRRYAEAPGGRDHLLRLARTRLGPRAEGLSEDEILAHAEDFFAGTHDVIVGRRHFVDGASTSDQLASSGTLTPAEHREYVDLTIDAMADLYATNPHVRYVAVFQNWLKPAGASFDHLHKQLVGIDELGLQNEAEIDAVRRNVNVFNDRAVNHAIEHGLVVAENEHAIAFAGVGHRYPSLEIASRSATCEPWLMTDAERHGMADLLHALHAATGADVPCNEEWHHRAPEVDVPVPWHLVLKWRISNLAGFEGGTKIYLNTLSPSDVRARVLPKLEELRTEGRLADGIRVGDECNTARDPLRYPGAGRAD